MSAAPVTLPFTVKNAINDDNPAAPSLTVHVDVSTTLPGNVKVAKTFPVSIPNPTADQIAAFKTGAAVTLTLALPAPATSTSTAGSTSSTAPAS